jgi:hypothetical protein
MEAGRRRIRGGEDGIGGQSQDTNLWDAQHDEEIAAKSRAIAGNSFVGMEWAAAAWTPAMWNVCFLRDMVCDVVLSRGPEEISDSPFD